MILVCHQLEFHRGGAQPIKKEIKKEVVTPPKRERRNSARDEGKREVIRKEDKRPRSPPIREWDRDKLIQRSRSRSRERSPRGQRAQLDRSRERSHSRERRGDRSGERRDNRRERPGRYSLVGYSSVFKQTAFCAPNRGVIILIYISQ